MIDALHLLWIIPVCCSVSAFLGFVLGAIMAVGKQSENKQ